MSTYNVAMKSCDNNDISQVIKQKRTLMPLTLQELGKMAGVSTSHLGRIERGERLPSAHVLRKIAKPLGFSVNELFMIAGFLSEPSKDEIDMAKAKYHHKGLNPIVAQTLANEPIEVQRSIIGILSILKILARSITR
jgi:transcriptional regulator with XRE-family HTH domain